MNSEKIPPLLNIKINFQGHFKYNHFLNQNVSVF